MGHVYCVSWILDESFVRNSDGSNNVTLRKGTYDSLALTPTTIPTLTLNLDLDLTTRTVIDYRLKLDPKST